MTEEELSKEYIEVDFYVCGVYRGKKKVGRNSICGLMLSGDSGNAIAKKAQDLADELNKLQGVKAAVTTIEHP